MQKQIRDFDWNERNIEHIAEHGVEDYEAEFVILFDKPIFRKTVDEKYIAYGITESGRYLLIIFSFKGDGLIRVITARDMVEREKRYYIERR